MDILERAKIKSGMLRMGEPIKFGSDADLIDEMSAEIELLRKECDGLRGALKKIVDRAMLWQSRAALKESE